MILALNFNWNYFYVVLKIFEFFEKNGRLRTNKTIMDEKQKLKF